MSKLETADLALKDSTDGAPVKIAGTAWNSVTELHTISDATAIDAVFLRLWNDDTSRALIKLILNPDDDTTQSNVDAVTVDVWVPAQSDVWALQGDRLWKSATQSNYTVAAYVNDSGQANKVRASGWATRRTQDDVTP